MQAPSSSRRRSFASVAAALAGVALLGCSSAPPPPDCPRVSVLNEASTLTRFAPGPGRDLVDVDYRAEIADLRSGCRFATEEKQQIDKLVVAVAPVFMATRGPANESGRADFEYFVSVVGAGKEILNQQRFPVSVAFPGNSTRVEVRQDDPPVSIDIPLKDEQTERLEIVMGLQLSRDELDYNRRARGLR